MATYVVFIVAVAFLFDFTNGFHDSANSIATIVGTRVLKPIPAVVLAAVFNFLAAFAGGTAVAKTVQKGLVDTAFVDPNVILGALTGAIVWNAITWYFGLPSSSSHALIGGYAGAAIAAAGLKAITWGAKWIQTLSFIVISPLVGAAAGYVIMLSVFWLFRRSPPGKVDRVFRLGQIASSALFSYAHGANDAQKTMGIILGLLVAARGVFASESGWMRHLHVDNPDHVPAWVVIGAYTAIALGTLFGGWRIVHTMGNRITRLRPVSGFAAELGGSVSIMLATHLAIPVSTTHAKTGSIVGVGATTRLSAVRWGIAGRIIWAWVLTIPAAGVMAALCWRVLHLVHPLK